MSRLGYRVVDRVPARAGTFDAVYSKSSTNLFCT